VQVWKHLRKRPFPSFVKQIFSAALFCSSNDPLASALRDAGDASSERRLKQLGGGGGGARAQAPLRIPDVVFSGLERFLTNRKWKIDDEALDDWVTSDERVTISTTTISDVSMLCYRGHGTLNMTPHKVRNTVHTHTHTHDSRASLTSVCGFLVRRSIPGVGHDLLGGRAVLLGPHVLHGARRAGARRADGQPAASGYVGAGREERKQVRAARAPHRQTPGRRLRYLSVAIGTVSGLLCDANAHLVRGF
jgi:hypothetical protein